MAESLTILAACSAHAASSPGRSMDTSGTEGLGVNISTEQLNKAGVNSYRWSREKC